MTSHLTPAQRQAQFTEDMQAAGFAVEPEYQGYAFYRGPAVRCEAGQIYEVISATTLLLQSDEVGIGYVIYPV